jgi:hypothetical protein
VVDDAIRGLAIHAIGNPDEPLPDLRAILGRHLTAVSCIRALDALSKNRRASDELVTHLLKSASVASDGAATMMAASSIDIMKQEAAVRQIVSAGCGAAVARRALYTIANANSGFNAGGANGSLLWLQECNALDKIDVEEIFAAGFMFASDGDRRSATMLFDVAKERIAGTLDSERAGRATFEALESAAKIIRSLNKDVSVAAILCSTDEVACVLEALGEDGAGFMESMFRSRLARRLASGDTQDVIDGDAQTMNPGMSMINAWRVRESLAKSIAEQATACRAAPSRSRS